MIKRSMLWLLIFLLGLGCTQVWAQEGAEALVSGDYQYELMEDGTARIIRYMGNESVMAVPAYLDEAEVTVIGANAFSECGSLTNVTLPDGVTSIEEGAFSDCGSLNGIILPAKLASIGLGAFDACVGLTKISFHHL